MITRNLMGIVHEEDGCSRYLLPRMLSGENFEVFVELRHPARKGDAIVSPSQRLEPRKRDSRVAHLIELRAVLPVCPAKRLVRLRRVGENIYQR